MELPALAKSLKLLRENRELSQRDLAKLLNIAPSTLAMYEIGKRAPDYDTLQKLADFFNCSVDYLLGRTDIRETASKSNKAPCIKYKITNDLEGVLESSAINYPSDSLTYEAETLIQKALNLDQSQQDAIKNILSIAHNIADKFKLINQQCNEAQANNKKLRETKTSFIEILDLLDKPDTPLAIGGRTLSLEERVQILEFLKEKVLVDEEHVATSDIVIAASYQGDSLTQNPAPGDIEDIKKAMEFVEQQKAKKRKK